MRNVLVLGFLFALLGVTVAHAHQLNPKVIERLTGETISYDGHHDEDVVVADPRNESRTYFSFPEWYIVYSAQEYGEFVSAGKYPSQFPFFDAIGQLWSSWDMAVLAGGEPDSTTNTVLWTIAVSFTVEYGIIGLYENTIGWVSEWLNFRYKTVEDVYTEEVAIEYGEFLNQTPWYAFPYMGALKGLWQTFGWSSLSPRGIERRISFTIGYGVKALYAATIAALSASTFEGGAGQLTSVELEINPVVLDTKGIPYEVSTTSNYLIASLPRYRAFRDPLVTLTAAGADFVSIQGNGTIALSLITAKNLECPTVGSYELFQLPLVTDEMVVRRVLKIPVTELASTIRALTSCGLEIEHVYDY